MASPNPRHVAIYANFKDNDIGKSYFRYATPVEYNIETMINGESSRDITRNLRQATGAGNYEDITQTDPPDDQDMMDVETFGRKRKRGLEVSDDNPPAPPLGTARAEPVGQSQRQMPVGTAARTPASTEPPNSEPRQISSSSSSSSSDSDSDSSSDDAAAAPEAEAASAASN